MKKENFFKRYPWALHLLLMVGVSVIILVLVFFFLRLYARQGQEYELPDVVGSKIETLEHDNPLELDVVVMDSIFRPGEEGGLILTQDPKAGTMVKKGRKLYVTMTAYTPEDAVLPELAGLTVRQAVNELSACKNSLAMACVDLYLKIGTEGQNSYSSNGVTRNFKYDWINASLLENLPNYVRTI